LQSSDWDPSRWKLPVDVTCLQTTASDAGTQPAAHSMSVLEHNPPEHCAHSFCESSSHVHSYFAAIKSGCLDCHQLNALLPSGQLALSVAEGNSEGAQATGKGKSDAWSFPTGHPLARKASSVEPSNAEPLPKKRKLSGCAAAAERTTLATSSPVESCAPAAAASKPDGPSAYGEAL